MHMRGGLSSSKASGKAGLLGKEAAFPGAGLRVNPSVASPHPLGPRVLEEKPRGGWLGRGYLIPLGASEKNMMFCAEPPKASPTCCWGGVMCWYE